MIIFLSSRQIYFTKKNKLLEVDQGGGGVVQQWNACLAYASLQQCRHLIRKQKTKARYLATEEKYLGQRICKLFLTIFTNSPTKVFSLRLCDDAG